MGEFKYRAFISYSHADEKWGRWLQHELESYRVPRALRNRETPAGPVPARLTPVFRDREDLPAAGNLSAEIQSALAESLFQVVICSPNAARSRWVNEEVRLFKRLHGGDRVLALIVAGEPMASETAGGQARECFPPALRFEVDTAGEITARAVEPLAADARPRGDGRRQAISKIAAGLLGLRLDDLVQREASRRARRAQAGIAASLALAGAMGFAALYANSARNEAEQARAEAESLIDFMLGELRTKLAPAASLDALGAVADRALAYYEAKDPATLDANSLGRLARSLQFGGEVKRRQADLDAALASYRVAAAMTAEQLRLAPDDPERIFEHAQSVFYVGDIAKRRGDFAAAEAQFQEYLALAERLRRLEPDNPRSRREIAYAKNGIGAVKFEQRRFDEARTLFQETIAIRRSLLAPEPQSRAAILDLAMALSWLARNEFESNAFAAAQAAVAEERTLLEEVLATGVEDQRVLERWTVAMRALARTLLSLGGIDTGYVTLQRSHEAVDKLAALYADEAEYAFRAASFYTDLAVFERVRLSPRAAAAAAERALGFSRPLVGQQSGTIEWRTVHGLALIEMLASLDGGEKRTAAANELAHFLETAPPVADENYCNMIAAGWLALGDDIAAAAPDEAARRWRRGIDALEPLEGGLRAISQVTLAELYLREARRPDAHRLRNRLVEIGYRHPDFMKMKELLQSLVEE